MNWEVILKTKHIIYYICFIIFFFTKINLLGVEKEDILHRIALLEKTEPELLTDSIEAIIPELYKFDQGTCSKMVREMLKYTNGRNNTAHLTCLHLLSSFSPGREIELLDSAYLFSVKNKLHNYRYSYYLNKSHYFRNYMMLDSSIFYTLKARDLSKENSAERYIETLHQMGDLYFSVGLYDDAERYYRLIYSSEIPFDSWEQWRKIVIRNNLALIDIENKNYEAALEKFNESIKSQSKPLVNFSDSLTVGYPSRKIAEIYFLTGEYQKSRETIQPWYHFFKSHQLEEHLFPSYQLLTRLAIKNDHKKEVEKYFSLFNEFLSSAKSLGNQEYESAKLASEVYEYLGDNALSLKSYKRYSVLKDSIEGKNYSSGLIQLMAEKDYENLENNFSQVKNQRIYLILFVCILLLFTLIIYLRSKKISKLNHLLVEANQTKEKLFSIIAHDLRNPFNIILGYSDLLLSNLNEFDKQTNKAILTDLKNVGKSTYILLENLLSWSRAQRNTIDFEPERIDLYEFSQNFIDDINSLAKEKEITLINNLPSEITCIYADRNMLSLIFRNLLTNAVKFTHVGGKIEIDMELSQAGMALFKIKDNGVGIPSEKTTTLFEFGKNESTHGTLNEKGTGLGLALCKEFISINHGKIWIASEVGKGSTFYFTLPLAGADL